MNNIQSVRVTLYQNGVPLHFDVTVDFKAIAVAIGRRAVENASHQSNLAGGAVKVEHIL